MRLTVAKKLNSLILVVLVLGIGGAIFLATHLFTTDLVGQLKRGIMDSSSLLAGRVRSEMATAVQRAQMLGSIALQEFRYPEDRLKFLRDRINANKYHLALSLYYRKGASAPQKGKFEQQWQLLNSQLINGKGANLATEMKRLAPPNFDHATKSNIDFETAVLSNGISLLRMTIPLVKSQKGAITQILVLDLNAQQLTNLFSESTAYTSYLVDHRWKVLASSDPQQVPIGTSIENYSFVKQIQRNPTGSGQFDYADFTEHRQIASYQKVGLAELTVIAQVPMAIAAAARDKLQKRTSLLAGAFIFLALTLGLLFSKRITGRITLLTEAADQIRAGDFSVQINQNKKQKRSTADELDQFTGIFNNMVDGLAERERLKGVFQKFHNKEITDKLLAGDIKLGGEKLEATVLLTDMRGFTPMSEGKEPEVVIHILNRYMTEMVEIILKHGGVVDKFIGDAILALWGVPQPVNNSNLQALLACIEMRCRLQTLNESFESEGLPPIHIGMGVNQGPLIAGNIGSDQRMEYTVIGDTVNTTSRIEAVTKEMGTDLLVSESVITPVQDRFVTEAIEEVRLKGKRRAVTLYKINGLIAEDGSSRLITTPFSNYDPKKLNEAA